MAVQANRMSNVGLRIKHVFSVVFVQQRQVRLMDWTGLLRDAVSGVFPLTAILMLEIAKSLKSPETWPLTRPILLPKEQLDL